MASSLNDALLVIDIIFWIFFLFSLAVYKETRSDAAKYLAYASAILSVVGLILLLVELGLLSPS